MLFSERSIWTMVHGTGLGGAALLGLAAALFYLYAPRPAPDRRARRPRGRADAGRHPAGGKEAHRHRAQAGVALTRPARPPGAAPRRHPSFPIIPQNQRGVRAA